MGEGHKSRASLELKTKSERLKILQDRERPMVIVDIKLLQIEVNDLLDQEDLKWK